MGDFLKKDTQNSEGEYAEQVLETVSGIVKRSSLPESSSYTVSIKNASDALLNSDDYRPKSTAGYPGGIVYCQSGIPAVIVPDLHARMDFLFRILKYRPEGTERVIDLLSAKKIQIICVGDGFHSERRALLRWREAMKEFLEGYQDHENMDWEMVESLGLMEMVMVLIYSFPGYFHFLKGNHENIMNEEGNGNYPFGKYAYEGAMVLEYMKKFYPKELLETYASFEKLLPLMAVGDNFVVTHAEPRRFISEDEIINYQENPDVIYSLTWTANDEAEEESVNTMLAHYLGERYDICSRYFGGHRPVSGLYNTRAEGKYVQIHNPDRFVIAYVKPDKSIDCDYDIREIRR
ncbi:MAG: hypothetical protein ACLFST_09920 [Spirochaetia bacterium]